MYLATALNRSYDNNSFKYIFAFSSRNNLPRMIVACLDDKGNILYQKKLFSFSPFVVRNEETNTEYKENFVPFYVKILPESARDCDKLIILILGCSVNFQKLIAATYWLNFKDNDLRAKRENYMIWVKQDNSSAIEDPEEFDRGISFDKQKPYILDQRMSRIAFTIHDVDFVDGGDGAELILGSSTTILTFPHLEIISLINHDTVFNQGIELLRPIDFLSDDIVLYTARKTSTENEEQYICGIDINSKMITTVQKVKG
jgi:hypothetical protein